MKMQCLSVLRLLRTYCRNQKESVTTGLPLQTENDRVRGLDSPHLMPRGSETATLGLSRPFGPCPPAPMEQLPRLELRLGRGPCSDLSSATILC